ncbi:hypothetical protein Leryth_001538 [Lithospermum erythrorhizon]|nr:hypothetical protein Leryth_001538 [Lithospermum erythrorhizon]
MYEFGEELIIESYKVPWLIWIQLLIMLLIILVLFFGFTIFSLDSTDSIQSSSNTSAASSSGQTQVDINDSSDNSSQVTEIQDVKRDSGGEITPEQIQAREGPSTKDVMFRPLRPEHPCHFLGLAKQAFLKCLGLDSGSESSSNRNEHMKTD